MQHNVRFYNALASGAGGYASLREHSGGRRHDQETNLCILGARLTSIAVHPYTKEYEELRRRFLEDLKRSIRGCIAP
jgi:hypothetical protein